MSIQQPNLELNDEELYYATRRIIFSGIHPDKAARMILDLVDVRNVFMLNKIFRNLNKFKRDADKELPFPD